MVWGKKAFSFFNGVDDWLLVIWNANFLSIVSEPENFLSRQTDLHFLSSEFRITCMHIHFPENIKLNF